MEKPKIIELTVQRKKFIIQEKINRGTKPIEFPQAQFLDKAGDIPVVVQRQVSTAQTVQKAMEVPLSQFTDKVVDKPVVVQRQISTVQTLQKTTETQQLQCIDKVIDVPVVLVAQVPQLMSDVQAPTMQVVEKTVEDPQLQIVVEETAKTPKSQTIQAQTLKSLSTAPVCRSTQAEIVEAVEIGAIPPTESVRLMFVTTPVLETPRFVAEYVQLAPAAVPQGTTQ